MAQGPKSAPAGGTSRTPAHPLPDYAPLRRVALLALMAGGAA